VHIYTSQCVVRKLAVDRKRNEIQNGAGAGAGPTRGEARFSIYQDSFLVEGGFTMARTLNCLHKEDWMCPRCCKCGSCCTCKSESGLNALVHINSLEAANAWRKTISKERAAAAGPLLTPNPEE